MTRHEGSAFVIRLTLPDSAEQIQRKRRETKRALGSCEEGGWLGVGLAPPRRGGPCRLARQGSQGLPPARQGRWAAERFSLFHHGFAHGVEVALDLPGGGLFEFFPSHAYPARLLVVGEGGGLLLDFGHEARLDLLLADVSLSEPSRASMASSSGTTMTPTRSPGLAGVAVAQRHASRTSGVVDLLLHLLGVDVLAFAVDDQGLFAAGDVDVRLRRLCTPCRRSGTSRGESSSVAEGLL